MIGIWKDPMIGTNLLFIIQRIDAPPQSQLGKGLQVLSFFMAEGCMQPMNLELAS